MNQQDYIKATRLAVAHCAYQLGKFTGRLYVLTEAISKMSGSMKDFIRVAKQLNKNG